MAMEQSPVLFDLAAAYHACRDLDTLLKTLATRLGAQLGARAVLVWLRDDGAGLECRARWNAPGERFDPVARPPDEGLLAGQLEAGHARRFGPREIAPQTLTHLAEAHRERVQSALYAPLPGAEAALGVVEALNKRAGEFTPQDAGLLEEACRLTAPALETRQAFERERQAGLETIERLTLLYDLSRVFNSTLELDELLPVVGEKIRDILGAQACNLWLPDPAGNELYFTEQVGEDPTTHPGDRTAIGEGLIGQVAQSGKPRLVVDGSEETLLDDRRKTAGDFELQSAMVAPLAKDDKVLAVVEVVNKLDGGAFGEDDLFFLTSIGEQAAIALHNANLLVSERKVHALDALLAISKEITATLDLDHVLTTVVHQAATVVPFDRCVIGLFDRGRFILGAVSGEAEVPKTQEMERLRELLALIAAHGGPVSADQADEGRRISPETAAESLTPFLEEFGYSGFYAVALRDEQGALGVLALLSSEANFLTASHLETLAILASQVTVAIRNAQLYQQVPLVSLLKPLAERKRKIASVPYGRWVELAWKAGIVLLVLVAVPWKMRVESAARVVPAEHRVVSAVVAGVVERVFVHEGDRVTAGQTLAQLDDGDYRARLAAAEANLGLARHELGNAQFGNNVALASQARLRARMYQAETGLYEEKVEQSRLRAPIAGLVVTPRIEEEVGRLLQPGDRFCELMSQDKMAAEIDVPEGDVALVRPGALAALKLNAFSTYTYAGRVQRVSPQSASAGGERFFLVRALFPNPAGHQARDGMVGHAKITAAGGWFHSGWYPVGYVLFRSPARWLWQKAWEWLP
jgi:RND family efflux transporter MFP subunit